MHSSGDRDGEGHTDEALIKDIPAYGSGRIQRSHRQSFHQRIYLCLWKRGGDPTAIKLPKLHLGGRTPLHEREKRTIS